MIQASRLENHLRFLQGKNKMGHINIPNTSVVYDNPIQVDQSTLVFPPGTGPTFAGAVTAGTPWRADALIPTANAIPANIGGTGYGMYETPQPGTFELNPPAVSPGLFNQQTVAPNTGTPIVTTTDSSGKTLTVHGTVAGVTVNNPG